MVDVKAVAKGIYLIDINLDSIPKWGSVYLINEEKKALIDTGPTSSTSFVLDGIKQTGVKPEDIDYLILTHIHLDHAGSAGVLIRKMPKAQVLVHHRGARHLIDPARLVSSVIDAQGEAALASYGEVVPVEAARIKSIYESDQLKLSTEQLLQFMETPGHAPHELCIYEKRNNGLFVGDTVGIYLEENGLLLPETPPPNFDPEFFIRTLERLAKLKVTKLYFAHFGVSTNVQQNLQVAIEKLQTWDKIASKTIKGSRPGDLVQVMTTQGLTEIESVKKMKSLYNYMVKVTIPTSVSGLSKYYEEKYQANLN